MSVSVPCTVLELSGNALTDIVEQYCHHSDLRIQIPKPFVKDKFLCGLNRLTGMDIGVPFGVPHGVLFALLEFLELRHLIHIVPIYFVIAVLEIFVKTYCHFCLLFYVTKIGRIFQFSKLVPPLRFSLCTNFMVERPCLEFVKFVRILYIIFFEFLVSNKSTHVFSVYVDVAVVSEILGFL